MRLGVDARTVVWFSQVRRVYCVGKRLHIAARSVTFAEAAPN